MSPTTVLILLLAQVLGYLIGSIPFAYVVTRLKTGQDIRTVGSGNVGATNVGRLLGFRYFILVFVLDFLKGAAPVLIAGWIANRPSPPEGSEYLPVVVGFAAILGHLFPIFLGMKGGKGVATTIGVLLCLVPWPTIAGLLGWIVVTLVSRMVSAGSIAFAMTFALVYFLMPLGPWSIDIDQPAAWSAARAPLSALVAILATLIIVKHRSNVARILAGTEPRIRLFGSKTKPTDPPPEHDAASHDD